MRGYLRCGRAEYIPAAVLQDLRLADGRYHSYAGVITSRWNDSLLYKRVEPWARYPLHESVLALDWAESRRIRAPSGPASLARPFLPRARAGGFNSILPSVALGGFQYAASPGRIAGPLYAVDLVSAYAWAARELPDIGSVTLCRRVSSPCLVTARVRIPQDAFPVPPFRPGRTQTVTVLDDEIAAVGAKVLRVYRAFRWTRTLSTVPAIEIVREGVSNNIWKACLRGFWGMWVARGESEQGQIVDGRIVHRWPVPNPTLNLFWAAVVTGRVRARVAAAARTYGAVHVSTDEIICRTLPSLGEEIGDWSLKAQYKGLVIAGTNRILDARGKNWYKHGGTTALKGNVNASVRPIACRAGRLCVASR